MEPYLYKSKRHNFRNEDRKQKIIEVLSKKQNNLKVILEEVHDSHNLSAVLRTCDAVGILDVDVIYRDERPLSLGKKSSSSAAKWVDVNLYNNLDDSFNKHKSLNRKILTTSLSENSISIYDIDFTQDIVIVFGNEKDGVSKEAVEKSDGNIIIPQLGMIQSLNISVAVAITLFEAFRQRQKAGMFDRINLPEDIYNNYLNNWLYK